jgi:predicted esterase
VLLLLHGTGGNEEDLLPLGLALDENATLLSPRGRVLENGMPRFFRRLAEGVFDEEDVVRRAHELAAFVEQAGRRYEFDPRRVVAIGYSNGANIAAAVMLVRPDILETAVLLRPMVPLSNPPRPDLSQHRALVALGEADSISPPPHGQELAKLLRELGAEVDIVRQPAGHGLVSDDVQVARQWLSGLPRSNGD